jgi:hypothetical protein
VLLKSEGRIFYTYYIVIILAVNVKNEGPNIMVIQAYFFFSRFLFIFLKKIKKNKKIKRRKEVGDQMDRMDLELGLLIFFQILNCKSFDLKLDSNQIISDLNHFG